MIASPLVFLLFTTKAFTSILCANQIVYNRSQSVILTVQSIYSWIIHSLSLLSWARRNFHFSHFSYACPRIRVGQLSDRATKSHWNQMFISVKWRIIHFVRIKTELVLIYNRWRWCRIVSSLKWLIFLRPALFFFFFLSLFLYLLAVIFFGASHGENF